MSTEYGNFSPRLSWCEPEVLLRRIAEEAYRAARYGLPFSVLLVNLNFSNQATDREMKDFAGSNLRELDFAGKLSERSYAFGMPHSPREGAEVVAGRLQRVLIDYRPRAGIAEAPEGGINPNQLLAAASNDLNERLGKTG